jgi:hypothetical protein
MTPPEGNPNSANKVFSHRRLCPAIGLALSLSTLACFRTPMDEQQVGTMNTTGGSGGVGTTSTSGGSTATIGNTGEGGMTGTTGGAAGIVGGIPSYASTTSSSGSTGSITGAGGSKCATTAQNACTTDDDCTTSDYRPPISSAADCYCFACGYAVSKTMAVDCQSAYDQFCGLNWQLEHGCEPPPCFPGMGGAACLAGMCQ